MDLDIHMWSALIPVKALDEAKSRLLPTDDPHRAEFAISFLEDVLAALATIPLASCSVVSSDDRVRRIAQAYGVQVIADPMALHDPLNAAIKAGADAIGGNVLVLAGDLPCLTPSVVQSVLAAAESYESTSFVSDAAGTGTTMLAIRNGSASAFGPRSRARHAAAGYAPLNIYGDDGVRARRDVDTPVDLWDATRIGVGAATQRVLDWSVAP